MSRDIPYDIFSPIALHPILCSLYFISEADQNECARKSFTYFYIYIYLHLIWTMYRNHLYNCVSYVCELVKKNSHFGANKVSLSLSLNKKKTSNKAFKLVTAQMKIKYAHTCWACGFFFSFLHYDLQNVILKNNYQGLLWISTYDLWSG